MSNKSRDDPKEAEDLRALGDLARQRGCSRVAVELLYWVDRMIDAARLQLDRIAASRSEIGYPDTLEIEQMPLGGFALAASGKYAVLITLVTDIELLFTCMARIDNSLSKGLLSSITDPKLHAIYEKYSERFKKTTDVRNHLEHMDERLARENPPLYVSRDAQGMVTVEEANYDIGHLRGQFYLVGGRWIDTSPEAFAFIDDLQRDLRRWLLSLQPDLETRQREDDERMRRAIAASIGFAAAALGETASERKTKKKDEPPDEV